MSKKNKKAKKPLPLTNDRRAELARPAVHTFCKTTGLDPKVDGLALGITDLLADLQHLCDKEGFNWDSLLTQADEHYLSEIKDERESAAIDAKKAAGK